MNLSFQSEISHHPPHPKTKTTAERNGAKTDNPVKSISQDSQNSATPDGADKRPQPRARRSDRSAKNAKWVESLKSSDVNRLWTELHRIVSHHPLVRASRSAGLLVEEGAGAAYTDLTQELFVQLLSKNRFEHYLETSMTDYEIECEISQIELTNLLTAELRKPTMRVSRCRTGIICTRCSTSWEPRRDLSSFHSLNP